MKTFAEIYGSLNDMEMDKIAIFRYLYSRNYGEKQYVSVYEIADAFCMTEDFVRSVVDEFVSSGYCREYIDSERACKVYFAKHRSNSDC